MSQTLPGEVVQYIRSYRGATSRESIDRLLISEGYRPAQIEAAWQIVEAEGEPEPDLYRNIMPWEVNVWVKPLFWVTLVGFELLSFGLPLLLTALSEASKASMTKFGGLSVLVFAILQLAGIAGTVFLWFRNRPVAQGLGTGVVLALGFFVCSGLFA